MNAGYGMNKLISWETLTGTRPTIESDRTIAVVSFPLKSALQRKAEDADGKNSANNDDDGKNGAKNGAKIGAKIGAKTTPRQNAILTLMIDNPKISLDEIAKEIGAGTSTVDREIAKMSHLVKRIGPKNGGYWEIINS